MRKKFMRTIWGLFLGAIALVMITFTLISNGVIGYMPDLQQLENPVDKYASQVFSDDGVLLGTWSYSRANRIYTSYENLSPYLVKALVATEDERFYEHSGIDFKAVLRAVVKRVVLRQKQAGGGSTITQQLAKQLYSDKAGTIWERAMQKPIEWVIAVKLERYYTKDEIITMYLNYFDFLHNAVRIKTAAKTYFNKEPRDLNLNECAMLVGMCKNPSLFNPVRRPDQSRGRRDVVLDQMVKAGTLSQAEADSCKALPIELNFHRQDHKDGHATYLREYLRTVLTANEPKRSNYASWQDQKYYEDSLAWENDPLYGWCNKNINKKTGQPYDLYQDGLKIYTAIDSRMQNYAEEAMRSHVIGTLQPLFDKERKGSSKAPYGSSVSESDVNRLLARAKRQSGRYIKMKADGCTEEEINKAFSTPIDMTVYTPHGEVDTLMTPMDSIRYYKWFLQASLISIESHTGHVKAYVGGLDYRFFKYDHVTQARRQVGSTFKPFLYSLAMQEGEFTPCTRIPNIPYNIQLEDGKFWSPGNAGGHVGEEITLKFALAQSNNWVSAYLMNRFGPNAVIAQARRMGVESPIDAVPAICLGVCDLKLIEMVGAMSTFANQGVYIKPMFITRIEDKNGNVIQRFSSEESEAMSEVTAYKMVELMKGVVQSGTGIRLRSTYGFTNPIAGKTGTTQKNSDGYFMGITPDLTTGVWVGAEDRSVHFRSTKLGQGSHTALPIWAMYMKKVYADKSLNISKGDFAKPYAPGIDLNFDCNRYDDEESIESIDEF